MKALKTIIVIGASSEIGQEISLKLASQGYNLLLTYNSSHDEINSLKEEINNNYKIQLSIVKLNLLSDIDHQFKKALEKISLESLIGMVFCAGYTPERKFFSRLSLDEVKKTFLINVISAYELASIVSTKMKSNLALEEGSIVFISSQVAKFGSNGISAYVASKGGLNSLGISLAKELGPSKIRVNIISPGAVKKNNNDNKVLSDIEKSIPLGRCCHSEDIANVVAFLFSKESKFLNGVDIPLNGGR